MSDTIGKPVDSLRERHAELMEKTTSASKSSAVGKGLNLNGFVAVKKDVEVDPNNGNKSIVISGTLDNKLYPSQCTDCGTNLHIKDYKRTRLLNGRLNGQLCWIDLLRIKQQCPKCNKCYLPDIPFRVGVKRYTINVISQLSKLIERNPEISNKDLSNEVGISGVEVGNIKSRVFNTPKRPYTRSERISERISS